MPASKVAKYLLLACLLITSSCNLPADMVEVVDRSAITATPFQPITGVLNVEGTAVEESDGGIATWWLSPALPETFRAALTLPEGAQVVEDQDQAHLQLSVSEGEAIAHWVYALVAPFPTVIDEVSLADVEAAWQGKGSKSFGNSPLMMTAETQAVFSAWWDAPGAGAVQVKAADQLLDAAWAARPAWALVPFEEVRPEWKVLTVDGQSPLWKTFEIGDYALSVPIGLSGDPTLVAEALQSLGPAGANRYAHKLTTVILTGVTALVRATAYEMNRSGSTYPAEDIGPLLNEADFTHISNEVPFAQDCPPPDPVQRGLVFCSDARHIELLEAVGVDVIELTGDHFNDWGQEAMLYTLQLYQDRGWPYYGGGANLEEAQRPLTFEHNGNKIAFIGCNGKGGSYASADVDYPGTTDCDYELMEGQIQELVAEGYVVVATFQHSEFYTFIPQPSLIRDFNRLSDAGAAIVSGSQAHQSHGIEFPRDGAIILYGLGNLFFDQRSVVEYGDKALIARNVIYDGRYISTELFTIQFVDFAKPRFMTAEERETFLAVIFGASIWHDE